MRGLSPENLYILTMNFLATPPIWHVTHWPGSCGIWGGHVTDQCCLLFLSSRAAVWNFSLRRYSVRVAVEFSRQKASSNARSGGGEKRFFPARSVWLPVVAFELAVFPFTVFIIWKWWAPTPGLLSIGGWCLVNVYSV